MALREIIADLANRLDHDIDSQSKAHREAAVLSRSLIHHKSHVETTKRTVPSYPALSSFASMAADRDGRDLAVAQTSEDAGEDRGGRRERSGEKMQRERDASSVDGGYSRQHVRWTGRQRRRSLGVEREEDVGIERKRTREVEVRTMDDRSDARDPVTLSTAPMSAVDDTTSIATRAVLGHDDRADRVVPSAFSNDERPYDAVSRPLHDDDDDENDDRVAHMRTIAPSASSSWREHPRPPRRRRLRDVEMRVPALTWGLVDRRSSSSVVRFNLHLLVMLRKWRRRVETSRAHVAWRRMAASVISRDEIVRRSSVLRFARAAMGRERRLDAAYTRIVADRWRHTIETHVRTWSELALAVACGRRRTTARHFVRWRRKHRRHKRVVSFVSFTRSRRQLTRLREWRQRLRERTTMVEVRYSLLALRALATWREHVRRVRATRRLIAFVTRSVASYDARQRKALRALASAWTERAIEMRASVDVVRSRRVRRVRADRLGRWRRLRRVRARGRRAIVSRRFDAWHRVVLTRDLGMTHEHNVTRRRLVRHLDAWRASLRAKRVDLARRTAADMFRRQRLLRTTWSRWIEVPRRRRRRRDMLAAHKTCTIMCAKRRVRRRWTAWRVRFVRRRYASTAAARTRQRRARHVVRHAMRTWRAAYEQHALTRRLTVHAVAFRDMRLVVTTFCAWKMYAGRRVEEVRAAHRRDQLLRALARWRLRATRSMYRRRAGRHLTLRVLRGRLRRRVLMWRVASRERRRARAERERVCTSRLAQRRRRRLLSTWFRAWRAGYAERSRKLHVAAFFWYERLISRTFREWHRATLRCELDDDDDDDDAGSSEGSSDDEGVLSIRDLSSSSSLSSSALSTRRSYYRGVVLPRASSGTDPPSFY